jgi:hypothetical protein
MSRRQAIDIALDALAKPGIAAFLSAGPLPDGLKCLLRIVAEGEWRDAATAHAYRTHGPEAVRAASAAFLSEVLFARQTDPYRVLGLPQGASLGEVREHKRLLLKWLHPDRNPDAVERELLSRVIAAAEAIEGGRSQDFGTTASRRPPPSPAHQAMAGTRKKRRDAPQKRQVFKATARAARQTASRSILRLMRAARLAAMAIAVLLSGLIAWRYLMEEPIGASITRYSKLALGIIAWP